MMSVKSKYQTSRFNDSYREVWSSGCDSFQRLGEISTVVSTCVFTGVRGRQKKLTQTGNAFLVATDTNIRAAKMLIETHEFEYVIPAVFSQNPLETFFGQCRQRVGGNFYIDIGDVIASAKAQHLHQLLKYDIAPVGDGCDAVQCQLCNAAVDTNDLELIYAISLEDTENVLESDVTYKQKLSVSCCFFAHKFEQEGIDTSEEISCDFIDKLSHGRLRHTLNTVFFVYSAQHVYDKLDKRKKGCTSYFRKLISNVDAPFATNVNACKTL